MIKTERFEKLFLLYLKTILSGADNKRIQVNDSKDRAATSVRVVHVRMKLDSSTKLQRETSSNLQKSKNNY